MNRTILTLAVTALLASGCSACAGKEFTVKKTFSVHASATDPQCDVDLREQNMGNDQAFMDLQQYISKIELKKVTISVANPKTSEESVATSGWGEVRISANQSDTALTLAVYDPFPIVAGSTRDITFDQPTADKLSELILQPPHVFWLGSFGCSDANPAFYDIQVALTLYAAAL
jgi:hypothetical protein